MSATPTIVIDTGHSVREARRQSTYDGWSESLTCQCGHEYTRPLLPIEAERARRGQRRA